ncbi:MAG: nucleotidyltransferase domain-containing protein [archaeon]
MEEVIEKIKKIGGGRVKFVFLFGSMATEKNNKFSDVDLAVYYDGSEKERFDFRVKVMGKLGDKYDVKIFQDLPLYLRADVLKGKLLYFSEGTFVYDVACETLRRFGDFKKYVDDYVERRKEVCLG